MFVFNALSKKNNGIAINRIYSKIKFLQESEQERLLSLKAVLPNGTYGSVFECTYTSGAEHWYCNMCECPIMGRVYHHEIGKRHTSNMSIGLEHSRNSRQQQIASGNVQQEIPAVQVAPGEPVPPGFEGEVEKVCEIQVLYYHSFFCKFLL